MTGTDVEVDHAAGIDRDPPVPGGESLPTAEAWAELVAVGLIGTERRPLPDGLVDTVATVLGQDLASGAPLFAGEVGVLTAAGVLAAYRRTGTVPVPGSGPTAPAADEDRRSFAPESAVRLLDLLLAGHVSVLGAPGDLLTLWLDRCAASGYRLPPARVVDLLGLATTRIGVRQPVRTIAGPLGVWLAARNPEWSWLVEAGATGPGRGDVPTGGASTGSGAGTVDWSALEQGWATGTREERMALLTRVRAQDPTAGLALVESTWKGEKAADRAAIVDALAATASMADEPFLEDALDDRGKAVRERAAALLQTMPDSRLARRAAERLAPLISSPKGLLRRKVDVSLPTELDPDALARDGFSERLRPAKVGLHAWELTFLVAVAPLRTWTDLLSLRPAEVVSATMGSDNFAALVRGWTRAVTDQSDAPDRTAWVLALLELPDADPALFALLPPELVHAAAARRIRTCSDAQLPTLVASLPGPWPTDLTRQVIDRVAEAKAGGYAHGTLIAIATHALPASIPDLQAWVVRLGGEEDARLRHLVNQAISTISFRQSIIQELP